MKKIIIALVFFISPVVLANEQISPRQVTLIQVYSNAVIVKLDTPHQNLEGCTKSNAQYHVRIPYDTSTGKELYAAVLSARMAGKGVGFGVSGCSPWGEGTVPNVYRIDL